MHPKDHVKNIKERYFSSDEDFVLSSLNRSIDRIQKAFPRHGSFLMEFIQNADDVNSTTLLMEISEDGFKVFNNGRVFSKEDVDSICRVGLSSKSPKDYIGYLGVGFKSVFLISDSPEIYSGDYQFKFSKTDFSNPERAPWQVIPLWIDNPLVNLGQEYLTAFNIPIKESEYLEKLQEETESEYISNRMLLFLRNLSNVKIKNSIQGTERVISKSLYSQKDNYEVYLIQEHLNGEVKTQEYWLVFKSVCDVPSYVKEDPITKDWERESVDKREVAVAFKLDETGDLIIEEKGTAHIGVFSFLPLKEVESGLNFLIQGDFLTTPGRGELSRECAWNNWLVKETYNLILENCIPIFTKNERWRLNFIEILYSPSGGHELFENNIKSPLRAYLKNEACLLTTDDSFVKPKDAVTINSNLKELVNEDDLTTLYPDKKILSHDLRIPGTIDSKINKGPSYNSSRGIDSEMKRLLELKAEQKDVTFFKNFYHDLAEYSEQTLQNSPLKQQDIVLTEDWDLVNY